MKGSKKILRRVSCLAMTAVMVFGITISAGAATFSIPTSPVTTDDNVIKTTAARAGQVAPLILGCNLVASSNLGASQGNYNKVSSILGVFGSDVNAAPDPYLYNYNYNLYAADHNLSSVENATVSEAQSEGTAATPEVSLHMLQHRPDLLLTQAGGTGSSDPIQTYADIIPTLPENTDSNTSNDYNPSYYRCSISTLVYQCENLINLANVVNEICEANHLTTRYEDPYTIATDYDKYVWGHYFYVQKQIAEGTVQKKTAAVVSKTEDNGANWTLPAVGKKVDQGKPNRLVEYVRDNTTTLNTTEEQSASLEDVLKNDVVIAIGNGDTLRSAASAAGVEEKDLPVIIETLPTCLYGMVMQTHENALGIPYLQSMIYGEELSLNPVYAAAYFYNKFFHITDNAALQETATTLLSDATLPEGVTTSLNQYDPEAIEAIITEGIEYATANGLKRHDDPEAWAPDLTVGIGSDTEMPFTDLTQDWYKDAVQYAYSHKLFNGTSETTFEPDTSMNRAMIVTILYRMAGSPAVTKQADFTDLTQDWYKDAVAWGQENRITSGTGDGMFSPDQAVTREQFVTLLANYVKNVEGKSVASTGSLAAFSDSASVSEWAVDSLTWAVNEGVISGIASGSNMLLDPSGSASRAQAAMILYNYLH